MNGVGWLEYYYYCIAGLALYSTVEGQLRKGVKKRKKEEGGKSEKIGGEWGGGLLEGVGIRQGQGSKYTFFCFFYVFLDYLYI